MVFRARRIARVLAAAVLAVLTLAGVAVAGMTATMRDVAGPEPAPGRERPAAHASSPGGSITVAVALGRTGTVFSDVLAPYEVFASSPRFTVYTVAGSVGPARTEGGPALFPVHTFQEVDAGAAPRPDVVVVPAVGDPTGREEGDLRAWVRRQHDRGASLLGVCSGARVLAAAGLLEGRRATSHWTDIDALERTAPEVRWLRGQRYVQDGPVTTTAGVTSGIPGALAVVADLAGPGEAGRVGRSLGYPGWSLDAPTAIPEQHATLADLPGRLGVALPWFKPTVGIGVADGVGEIDLAAAFEVYHRSFAARPILLAPGTTATTRHGIVLAATPTADMELGVDRVIVPGAASTAEVPSFLRRWSAAREVSVEPLRSSQGELGFDAALEDLGAHAGRSTALAAAKVIDYPADHLHLAAERRRWRIPALAAAALLLALGVGVLTAAARRDDGLSGRAPRHPMGE